VSGRAVGVLVTLQAVADIRNADVLPGSRVAMGAGIAMTVGLAFFRTGRTGLRNLTGAEHGQKQTAIVCRHIFGTARVVVDGQFPALVVRTNRIDPLPLARGRLFALRRGGELRWTVRSRCATGALRTAIAVTAVATGAVGILVALQPVVNVRLTDTVAMSLVVALGIPLAGLGATRGRLILGAGAIDIGKQPAIPGQHQRTARTVVKHQVRHANEVAASAVLPGALAALRGHAHRRAVVLRRTVVVELAAIARGTAETVLAVSGDAIARLVAGKTIGEVGLANGIAVIVGRALRVLTARLRTFGLRLCRLAGAMEVWKRSAVVGQQGNIAPGIVVNVGAAAPAIFTHRVDPVSLARSNIVAHRSGPELIRAVHGQ